MNCIKCKQPMTKFVYNNVIIDQCYHCGGIWLDRNELYQLLSKLQLSTNSDFNLFKNKSCPSRSQLECMDIERFLEKRVLIDHSIEQYICPRCGKLLEDYTYFGVNLEYCSKCNGMFFDKLELENICKKIKVCNSYCYKLWNKIKSLFKHEQK